MVQRLFILRGFGSIKGFSRENGIKKVGKWKKIIRFIKMGLEIHNELEKKNRKIIFGKVKNRPYLNHRQKPCCSFFELTFTLIIG
jgi:hypothetical protein